MVFQTQLEGWEQQCVLMPGTWQEQPVGASLAALCAKRRRLSLVGGRGRFAERALPASKEDLVCTPQQYRNSGSYFSLEENGRLFAPPSPETGEAKRSAFVEVKKAARAAGGPEEAADRKSVV